MWKVQSEKRHVLIRSAGRSHTPARGASRLRIPCRWPEAEGVTSKGGQTAGDTVPIAAGIGLSARQPPGFSHLSLHKLDYHQAHSLLCGDHPVQRWLLVAALAALLVFPFAASAQSGVEPIPADLDAQMDLLVRVTETLRWLTTLSPVERAFPTREETIAYLTELFHTDLPPEEAARFEAFYQVLGLLPADVDLAETYLKLLGAQVAGFYDTDTRVMNVIPMLGDSPGDALSLTEQIIFVHEYDHALQDQHFSLAALDDPAVNALPDRALALTALVEGDASAVMQLYAQELMTRNPLAALSLLAEGALSNTLVMPPGTPEVLSRELLFPYEQGMAFVVALAADGGWQAVDAAYANPPATTEQIIHPEKYLVGEGALTRPEWDALAAPEGWATLWDVPLGEYYLREHLRTLLPAADAATAASGWGGDRFLVFEAPDGARLWLLASAWDTPEDAAEFAEAYRAGLTESYGDPLAEDDRCHATGTGVACLVTPASGDTRIVYAPTLEDAAAYLDG